MTEQDNRTDNERQVQNERENLVEKHGSLKETPLRDIEHFENHRAALEAKYTRNELKSVLSSRLLEGLSDFNASYDDIDNYEDFDFSDTGYLTERQLAQLATMAESVTLTCEQYKLHRDAHRENYGMLSDIYFERLENSYLKPTVWIKRKLQAFKERFK